MSGCIYIYVYMYVCMDVTLSCGHDNLKRVADNKLMKFGGLIFNANISKPIGGFLKNIQYISF